MANHILKCKSCQTYTLHEDCSCGGKAATPSPSKFSPEDKYSKYRREVKEKTRRAEGLL